jgi:hypothetical protein
MNTRGKTSMKSAIVTILILLLASSAFAQGAPDSTTAQIHQGTRKIGMGLGLVGAALLIGPLNERAGHPNPHQELNDALVAGFAGTGTVLIAWGAWQRWHAVNPQTTLGVTLGNRAGVQIIRRW